jgi:hypothetical protein
MQQHGGRNRPCAKVPSQQAQPEAAKETGRETRTTVIVVEPVPRIPPQETWD